MTLERYSHVMHLTSQVSGELRRRQDADRRAAGHAARRHRVSGAPKVRAMEIIDELEPVKRGPVRRRRRLRRLLRQPRHRDRHPHDVRRRRRRASSRPAPGIVADSIPDDEDLECRNKAAALLAAVPAARRMTAQRTAANTPA